MKYSCISDLHIKNDADKASLLFEKFSKSKQVVESEKVYLLGDIFDLMIGNHKEYITIYSNFFKTLSNLIKSGKKIVYIEGNHDFHLEEVMKYFCKEYSVSNENFKYLRESFTEEIDGKNVLFTHGHEVDYYNDAYKRWKRIYTSRSFKFFIDYILPFSIVKKYGAEASKNSKKRGRKKFEYEKAKEKYLVGVKQVFKGSNYDIIIAGHTHIEEDIYIDKNQYINNGFPLNTNKFIHYDGHLLKLIDLN